MTVLVQSEKVGESVYRCDHCGHKSRWINSDWHAYGSVEKLKAGEAEHYCTRECLDTAKKGVDYVDFDA
ncbi:hypothetical protein [Thaumasiovibrio sp. DFM-14]|uniref:hypothetical protein n=1 Tax=Thaumasiovibrio sp. DFM-14 TaxID=3384792 RepID=UPI0039A0DDCF